MKGKDLLLYNQFVRVTTNSLSLSNSSLEGNKTNESFTGLTEGTTAASLELTTSVGEVTTGSGDGTSLGASLFGLGGVTGLGAGGSGLGVTAGGSGLRGEIAGGSELGGVRGLGARVSGLGGVTAGGSELGEVRGLGEWSVCTVASTVFTLGFELFAVCTGLVTKGTSSNLGAEVSGLGASFFTATPPRGSMNKVDSESSRN